jgi:selenocysteine-specific elongation factor
MHVIATAGHVDHGKSTLVRALTGIDPDRLEEEKRRGLTIDLGFAWLRLPSGREVGIVDVPGHERFIKNMLAGVGAINVTLFVVAANEGWKPQSQEHLDILDLLGVDAAVIAITKADAVEPSRVEEVASDVRRRIERTTLAGSALIPISAATGEGLEALIKEIDALIARTPAAPDTGRPRLWIDRVFTMKGSGTVVTGTLVDGGLAQDQEIELLPGSARARIRSIQSHRRKVEQIGPGNRTALNIVGIDPEQLARGEVISTPGKWSTTKTALVAIQFLPDVDFSPTERGAFKFHTGSAERDAEITFLDTAPEKGSRTYAAIKLNRQTVLDWRDRFVFREAGRRMTVGGGLVLEAHPSRTGLGGRALLDAARRREEAPSRTEYLEILLEDEGHLDRHEISLRTGLDPAETKDLGGVWLATTVYSQEEFDRATTALIDALRQHQSANPLDAGLSREAARAALEMEGKAFDEFVQELEGRGAIVTDENLLRTPDHIPAVEGTEHQALIAELEAGDASPPTISDLERRFDPALIKALVRARELIQVSRDLVYTATRIERLKTEIGQLINTHGPMTVAAFRDLVKTTRKYAVPLLEYLDQIGFTRRQGDVRVLGPKTKR